MELSLANLLLVLMAGWLAGWATARIGYPSVLGELMVGILLGPPMLGLLHGSEALAVLAEIGILLMMLYVGMEIDPREMKRASWGGILAAVGGFVVPFGLAYVVMIEFGTPPIGATFVGIAAGVTSLTTKSRILVDLRLLDTRIAHVMMAAALLSDTLSLILFAGVLSVVDLGRLDLVGIGVVTLKVVVFFAVSFFLGLKVFPRLGQWLTRVGLTSRTFHFTFVLLLAVAFGELAELADLHAILGAFLAGLFLRDNVLGRSLSSELMGAVREASIGFLAPIFFVTAGFEVSLSVFRDDLALLMAIVGVATLGKIAGTALLYSFTGNGWREGLTIGGGMNGRGAVEIIVAGIALEMGLISTEVFSILVFMAIFTTATVPFLLKWGTDWLRGRGELVRARASREGLLMLGGGPLALRIAGTLGAERPVWVVDTNPGRCRAAEAAGLNVVCGNALREQVMADAHASEAEMLVAMTANAEINALAGQLARSVFMVPEMAVVHEGAPSEGHDASLAHLGASTLFGVPVPVAEWDVRVEQGAVAEERIAVEQDATGEEWARARIDVEKALPIVILRGDERLLFHSDRKLQQGDEVVVLRHVERVHAERDRFDDLLADAPILDVEEPVSLEQFFALAADELAPRLGLTASEVFTKLWERERAGSTVVTPGLAVPHLIVEDDENRFALLVARCQRGVRFPAQEEAVKAVFVLASSPDERTFHLRALSAIAQVVHDPRFAPAWRDARGSQELRRLLLSAERKRW